MRQLLSLESAPALLTAMRARAATLQRECDYVAEVTREYDRLCTAPAPVPAPSQPQPSTAFGGSRDDTDDNGGGGAAADDDGSGSGDPAAAARDAACRAAAARTAALDHQNRTQERQQADLLGSAAARALSDRFGGAGGVSGAGGASGGGLGSAASLPALPSGGTFSRGGGGFGGASGFSGGGGGGGGGAPNPEALLSAALEQLKCAVLPELQELIMATANNNPPAEGTGASTTAASPAAVAAAGHQQRKRRPRPPELETMLSARLASVEAECRALLSHLTAQRLPTISSQQVRVPPIQSD